MTIEVSGRVVGSSLVYNCTFCGHVHTHGYIEGQTEFHRVSHCALNDESLLIKIGMTKQEQACIHSATYYRRHREEVRRKRIQALMTKGHMPKPATLEKHKLQAAI